MFNFLSLIALGFFLGMRHATDPDHVIAVTTIVSRQRSVRYAAIVGVLWGLGHTITILIVGSSIILFNVVIPPRFGLAMELSVGIMLVVLGILNLSGWMRFITATIPTQILEGSHSHFHVGFSHGDPDSPGSVKDCPAKVAMPRGGNDRVLEHLGLYQMLRPLAVGVVHGLAGSAAVAILVLATIQKPSAAVIYLLVFGLGTIAGMMVITVAIAVPFTFSNTRFANLNRGLGLASGAISLCFGLFLVYQLGFVNGLFSSNPIFMPR